jgi:hypothetical protein
MWIIFEFVHINYVIASDSVAISSCSILKWFNTAHCRRGYYFCRNKSNKNAFFFLGFFAAQSLHPANQPEPRAAKSCPTSFTQTYASANICYAPLPRTRPPLFCLISAEASCTCLNQNFLNFSRVNFYRCSRGLRRLRIERIMKTFPPEMISRIFFPSADKLRVKAARTWWLCAAVGALAILPKRWL